MHAVSLVTLWETIRRIISDPVHIRIFSFFLVLMSILIAGNIVKRRKTKKEEQLILENGLTFEKAYFCEQKASDFEEKAFMVILFGFIAFIITVCEAIKTLACCSSLICIMIGLTYVTKMVVWHNRAVPYFREMCRETAASLGPDNRLADSVLLFMECTKYKDPYLSFGRGANEKTNEAIMAAERDLFTETLSEARRENDVTKSFLADMKMRLIEKEKSVGNDCKMAIDGLQKRIEYLMRYDKVRTTSSAGGLR